MNSDTHVGDIEAGSVEMQIRTLLERTLRLIEARQQPAPSASGAPVTEPQNLRVARIFGLSSFETSILLLCLAAELYPETAELCAAAHGDCHLSFPTLQLALRVLDESDWNAVLPQAPLRRWNLIEIGAGNAFLTSPLSLVEPVLHFLMGASALDECLRPMLEHVAPPQVLPSCYRAQAERLVAILTDSREQSVVAHLSGKAKSGKHAVAAVAAATIGMQLQLVRAPQLPLSLKDRDLVQRMLERDAAMSGFALLIDFDDATPAEAAGAAQLGDTFAGVVLVCGDGVPALRHSRVEQVVVDLPDSASRQALWSFALGDAAACCNGHVERVATQFSLDYEDILRSGAAVRHKVETGEVAEASAGEHLLVSCQARTRSELDLLAQRIPTHAGWRDLVLPNPALDTLRAITGQVRQQGKVLERWGFASQTSRGLGISALFHGPSGTGKTLAAEVLAHDLGLDLWRIDLSQMVSKYIGETEKNLRAIFDAAENTGSILLFDEADALFGRRSEVRDSHDRYANIEVSYLLQRIESYRGLAILTSNLRVNLDSAFLRRITFLVAFPFPDQTMRGCIWERMFPSAMPSEGLDYGKLARLNLAGGNIRNIALNAAYIAADLDQPVRMEHLLTAARRECAKIDRTPTAAETGGWV